MPKTFDDDWIAFPHAVGVLERLKSIMPGLRLPGPCTSSVIPGDVLALDYIGDECDSFAWTRITSVFPSRAFPQPDESPSKLLVFATGIEVGLVRRMEIPDNGEPVAPEDQYEIARTQMADMRAMLQALCEYAGDDTPLLVGQYAPLGPEGGVVGGTWNATIGAI